MNELCLVHFCFVGTYFNSRPLCNLKNGRQIRLCFMEIYLENSKNSTKNYTNVLLQVAKISCKNDATISQNF